MISSLFIKSMFRSAGVAGSAGRAVSDDRMPMPMPSDAITNHNPNITIRPCGHDDDDVLLYDRRPTLEIDIKESYE
jgi:hypothetical protein